jgi:phosphoesterase RecJ-like protein
MTAAPTREIWKTLKGAARVVVATHVQADGDAVGSTLGLVHGLRARGVRASPWPLSVPPRRYGFLAGFDELAFPDAPGLRPGDVAVALDSADPSRLPAGLGAFIRDGKPVINIDHHRSNAGFGAVNWVDPAAPAVAAMIWTLLREDGGPFPPAAAAALYVGLVADTGGFTYSNTNPWAHQAAADLIARGADPAAVDRGLNQGMSLAYLRILGAALAGMRREGEGVIYTVLSREAMTAAGATPDDTEGIVDYTRRAAGCRIGILFRELDAGVKVSFRAEGDVDVLPLAQAHGGGGHAAAAGCRVDGTLEEVKRLVLTEAREWLAASATAS